MILDENKNFFKSRDRKHNQLSINELKRKKKYKKSQSDTSNKCMYIRKPTVKPLMNQKSNRKKNRTNQSINQSFHSNRKTITCTITLIILTHFFFIFR